MDLEILHVTDGDRKRRIDTRSESGRRQAAELIGRLLKRGTALFLERGKRTYRIKGYDPKSDKLTVQVGKKLVATRGQRAKATAVAPSAGG